MMALLGAVGYGMGGVGGRRSHPELIPIAIQTVGIMVAVLAVVLGLGGAPTASVLVWGAVSGIGNGALLRGSARGIACGRAGVGGGDGRRAGDSEGCCR